MNWHIKDFGIESIWQRTKGKGVRVAIIDSGIALHQDIPEDKIVARHNFIQGGKDVSDTLGHGTHCAGIVGSIGGCGVAPEIELMIGKVTDQSLGLNEQIVFEGLKWAYETGADIISISATVENFSQDLKDQIADLHNSSNTILVSALSNLGDMGFDCDFYPAILDQSIAVGAIDQQLNMDQMTGRSTKADVLAPGRDIKSTWNDGSYRELSGCSMAAPFVAGVLALMLSDRRQSNTAVNRESLIQSIKQNTKKYGSFASLPDWKIPIIQPDQNFIP